MQKNKKKLLPLAILAGVIVLLGAALAMLNLTGNNGSDTGAETRLFDWTIDEVTGIRYSGNSNEASFIKGAEGNWMLESDPTLPLTQTSIQTLAETLVTLPAQRKLTDTERGEIPPQSAAPAMVFSVTAGDTTRTLTFDTLNSVAEVYYVYDDAGAVYTVYAADVSTLTPSVKSLYAAQSLTGHAIGEVSALQVGNLAFTRMDGTWTLDDDTAYPLDQDAVTKMARAICELQTSWTITTPQSDATYGLDAPDITATLTFTDGTTLTARVGKAVPDDDSLCYLATDAAKGVVYEVPSAGMAAFAVTKATLAAPATEETAATASSTANIVAENPVGGVNDYADAAS